MLVSFKLISYVFYFSFHFRRKNKIYFILSALFFAAVFFIPCSVFDLLFSGRRKHLIHTNHIRISTWNQVRPGHMLHHQFITIFTFFTSHSKSAILYHASSNTICNILSCLHAFYGRPWLLRRSQ